MNKINALLFKKRIASLELSK